MNKPLRYCTVLIISMITCLSLLAQEEICWHGLTYKRNRHTAWAKKQFVITHITPLSPAKKAGLKEGDIIETIDSFRSIDLSDNNFDRLIKSANTPHVLEVSNFAYKHKKCLLELECHSENVINERDFAQHLQTLSPQDFQVVSFQAPFQVEYNKYFNFSHYPTFSIKKELYRSKSDNESINRELRKLLIQRGLQELPSSKAKLIVKTKYQLKELNAKDVITSNQYYFYDFKEQAFFKLSSLNNQVNNPKRLNFEVSIHKGNSRKAVWSANIQTLINNKSELSKAVLSLLPAIFKGFPYTSISQSKAVKLFHQDYLYTGLKFNKNNLNYIKEVEYNSPAFHAGLKADDEILSINHQQVVPEMKLNKIFKHLKQYQKDIKAWTQDTEGASGLMFKTIKPQAYENLYNLLAKDQILAPFTYIYGFRPYILKPSSENILFEIRRKGIKHLVWVQAKRNKEYIIDIQN